MITTTVVSGYPKILNDQVVRRTIWNMDAGKATAQDLSAAFDDVTRAAIHDQERAGVDVITDGCIRWNDEITYVASGLAGFDIRGLIRFFDTNVLYREPVAVSNVQWTKPILVKDFQFAKQHAHTTVKPVLTGPFTLTKLSKDEHYHSEQQLLDALAEALNQELTALEQAGATVLHVNEPAFLQFPHEASAFQSAMKRLFHGVKAKTILYFYFGNVEPVYKTLLDLDVTALGCDLSYSPRAAELVARDTYHKEFVAGLIDARNTKLESKAEVFETLNRLTHKIHPEKLSVAPSANLEFLPLDRCQRKLQHMVDLVKAYEEEAL